MTSLRLIFGVWLISGFTFNPIYGQSDSEITDHLDQYIESARVQWEVPGLAVAIVKDGKVLLSKGYGVKSLQHGDLVGSKTIFSVGSTTKAMTSAAMAMLVDEGKVKWASY